MTGLTLAGALAGMVVLGRPSTATIKFPTDIAEVLPENCGPETVTLWKLGDPPLECKGATTWIDKVRTPGRAIRC